MIQPRYARFTKVPELEDGHLPSGYGSCKFRDEEGALHSLSGPCTEADHATIREHYETNESLELSELESAEELNIKGVYVTRSA